MIKKFSLVSVFVLCLAISAAAVSVTSAQGVLDRSSAGNSDLSKRTAERIKRQKTDLTDGQIKAIEAKCIPAQNKIGAVRKAAEAYSSTQEGRVGKIYENLIRLSENLKNRGVDTSQLDQETDKINQLKDQIDSTYQDFLQSLDDSVQLECKIDPEGFRATIDDAKDRFDKLQDKRKFLRDLIKSELKDVLVKLRSSL